MHFAYPKGGFGRDFCLESGLHNHGLQAIKVLGFFRKNSVGLSKTNLTCPDDLTGEKHFSKFSSLSLLLDYEQNFFRNLTEILSAALPNLPSTVSEIFKGKKTCLTGNIFSHQFLISSWWFSGFLSKSSEGSLKLHSTCPEELFEEKKNFELKSVFSISLWIWADDFQDSDEKCRKYHQSCILTVRTNIFPKKMFWRNTSQHFRISRKKISVSPWEIFGMIDKPSFWVSRRKLWGNKTCIKELIQVIFWLWEKKFQTFSQNIPVEPSKQHSTYPEDDF